MSRHGPVGGGTSRASGDRSAAGAGFFERVYTWVEGVPRGRVTTYGAVARALSGGSGAARSVGWALHGLPADRVDRVPWWRVVNAQGRISTSCSIHSAEEQRARLEAEGVAFDASGRIDLERFGWPEPPFAAPGGPGARRDRT